MEKLANAGVWRVEMYCWLRRLGQCVGLRPGEVVTVNKVWGLLVVVVVTLFGNAYVQYKKSSPRAQPWRPFFTYRPQRVI